jgi:hypothetical protein
MFPDFAYSGYDSGSNNNNNNNNNSFNNNNGDNTNHGSIADNNHRSHKSESISSDIVDTNRARKYSADSALGTF